MTEISLQVDEYGRVLGAAVHDSYLSGFTFSDGELLQVFFRGVSGGVTSMKLVDVGEVNFADMCNGAIVSDVYVWKVGDAPDAWGIPDSAWNVLFSSRLKPEDVKSAAQKIVSNKPDALLVQVTCSYGGSIAAVCRDVTLQRA